MAVALAVLIAALFAASGAAAAPSSLLDTPAADQYVETLPASDGPKFKDRKQASKSPLPPKARAALDREGGSSASQLEQVATSSDYGAPQRKLERKRDARSPSIPSAAVNALGDDSGGDLLWLLIALVGSTALVLGAVGYQHHQQRRVAG